MYYIVGLGNPGKKYENTRHNVGRDVLFSLAEKENFTDWEKSKHANALYSRGAIAGNPVEALLPETFMNTSGETTRYVAQKHNAAPNEFIVVYDDVDVPVGEIKISIGRGDGGHNGIKSIIQSLKSKEFVRIRVGIARTSFWTGKTVRPRGGNDMNTHVLGVFTKNEQKKLETVSDTVGSALACILTEGVEKAMNMYN